MEWLKNRNVTVGCTASAYCPDAAVSRLGMAAFMNRLGTALTPVSLRYDGSPGAIDLDAGTVACQTADFTATGYPRRAFVDASLAAVAPADTGVAGSLVARVNAGPWQPLNAASTRLTLPAGQWAMLADLGVVDVAAGDTVRFGLQVDRGGLAGMVGVSDSRCQLRALVYSRDGAASPY